jgi:methenyltetrahydromethanopterin cyclohydrolase
MKKALSVNRLAWKLLDKMLNDPELYGVQIEKTTVGATLVDAGIRAKGGYEAGRLITEICMGGCGKAEITCKTYSDLELPMIFVRSDHPVVATLGSQYAGWQISQDGYFAIGSGPARALALKPKEIYNEISYKDDSDKAIVVLETDKQPPAKLIERLAKDCGISAEKLAIVLTPTSSVAGATQISGRIVETGIHKLRKLGLDPNTILYAWGSAPIPPAHPKFAQAMARTNDAILYGGTAHYTVNHPDDGTLKRIVEKAPSKASKDYGKPFMQILKEAEMDFYRIDPNLFAPALLAITNIRTGAVFRSGVLNVEALARSFGEELNG